MNLRVQTNNLLTHVFSFFKKHEYTTTQNCIFIIDFVPLIKTFVSWILNLIESISKCLVLINSFW